MSHVSIRSAGLPDSSAIARLMTQLGYATSADEMKERLLDILLHPDYITYVAELEGEIVGIIGAGISPYYEKDGTYGRLLALEVDEKWRGRGVGALLVAEAERWLQERGVTWVIVNSGSQRSEAHRFYRRLGYRETGLRFVKSLRSSPPAPDPQ